MNTPIIAEVAYLSNGDIHFRFTHGFDEDVIGLIKSLVRSNARSYDSETKTWTISERYSDALIERLQRRPGLELRIDGARQKRGFRVLNGGAGDPDLMTLHLRDDAPPELIDAAYRCLSKLHHPDVGGDTARMQALNAAYERLQARQRRQGVA